MGFKRLLTVALMALFCAGTATAASQLNSVQVTPKANEATVTLRTTGSYAHKEYRPDEHLMLVDLTGVTADPAVERTVTLKSAVLQGYKLSSYTSASGSEVTRIELELGDNVSPEVIDRSDGLQILLSSGGIARTSPTASPIASSSASPVASAAAPKPALVEAAKQLHSTPDTAAPAAKRSETLQAPAAPARLAERPAARLAEPSSTGNAPTSVTIRNISVQRGHGTLDVIIEGPNSAHPFLLRNPDRLVLDFSDVELRSSVRNIAVHTKDVLRVRVGRYQSEPPITRIVIDLSGPRSFDVVPSAQQVIVRIKTEDAAMLSSPLKAAPALVLASAQAPDVALVRPVVMQVKSVDAVKPSRPLTLFPGQASVEAPVAAPVKPVVVQVKSEDAVKPSQPLTLSPAQASVKAPVAASVKPVAAQVKSEDAAKPSPSLKAAPAPELASADVPESVRMNSGGNGAHADLVSASSAPHPEEVAMLASSSTSRLREQQISEPKSRAGIAADTLAASARAGQPPVGTEQPSGSAMLATPKYTGEPISVNLKDVDLKDFFRLIHEISGLNIVLDPSVRGTVTLVLDDVPWDQALDIVLKNNGLDRELQGNVLRIAATDTLRKEAVDRRAQSEAIALAVDRQTITRFLSYAKAKDIVPTIKRFLTARGDVISDERTNALIISDIPSVLPNLDRLISQLDRKSQEVEIEVRVVSATRSFSRDLGVQLGFNWGNGVTGVGGLSTLTQSSSTSSTTGVTTVTNSNPGTIPLFTNLPATNPTTGFTFSNLTKSYGIDAILTAAETHNLAKVLSRPRVVTQSNVKAEVKQGVKIPVYTQGTANANASVSYVDAVLRLSVTPQITSDNTIFLTVDVENTQPSGTINSNYILTTQQATTQVLVTDGGTVVIGGVIQTTNTVSTTQTPALGSIPWLGNLFKERSVSTNTEELIFFITPKIIQT